MWMHIKSPGVWKGLLIEQQSSSYDFILLFIPFHHFFYSIPLSAESENYRILQAWKGPLGAIWSHILLKAEST